MGFWEIAKGKKDLERVARIHEGVITAQIASDRGEPMDMTEVTVRWRRMSQQWEENPVIIPTEHLGIACQLAMSYQDVTTYPVLHADARTANEEHGRYVTFKNDEMTVIELLTKPHVPEQNQDDRRRAKLRGNRGAQNLGNPDPVDLSGFGPRNTSVAPE